MKLADTLRLLGFIAICQLAGLIGALFTFSAIPSWYAYLDKPPFSPPNYLFGPVWTILYTLMGISAYLIYKKGLKKKEVKSALKVFAAQLILNSLWSIFFFGLRNPELAFAEIILMLATIVVTILRFNKISKTAAYLLIPYLLLVSFASILNLSIALLN